MRQLAFPASLLALTAILITTPPTAYPQAGDAKDAEGQIQREIWREMDVPPAPVVSPEQSLEKLFLGEGWSLELVASEPMIHDPVAIKWDEFGRLWVAEMQAYMPDASGTGEDKPVSRVVVLEDTNEDGTMDKSTVFLDQLILPRAIAFTAEGVLIADPPHLYLCPDVDGDLVADSKRSLAIYGQIGNVEHAENGLLRGIDNWIYNAKSSRRIKLVDGELVEEPTHRRGQWGIAQDDWGRLYYNNNSSYLHGDLFAWENISRHPGWTPKASIDAKIVSDQSIFSIRINPGINRAYRKNWLRPDNRIRKTDAVSAPVIHRGNRYPLSERGHAYVPEPAGNVVSRFRLLENGVSLGAEKRFSEHPEWGPVEFIASTDERFRPVAMADGPDGFIYLVDLYRGIIQHKTYLTTFLRTQIEERGLDKPIGLGRIYRLVHESDNADRSLPELGGLSDLQLVEELSSEVGWVRDTAQRLLVQRQDLDPAAMAALEELIQSGEELSAIHAIWTLVGLEKWDATLASEAIESGSSWQSAHALRASAHLLQEARQSGHQLWTDYLSTLSADEARVRLEALQLLPETGDGRLLIETLASLTSEELESPHFLDTAVSSLYSEDVAFLDELAKRESAAGFERLIAALAEANINRGDASRSLAFARIALDSPASSPIGQAVEQGFTKALQDPTVRALRLLSTPEMDLESRPGLADAFVWPGKAGFENASAGVYSKLETDSIQRGQRNYQNICALCHGEDGKGIAALGPALAASPWVTGSKERLALIVGQGLSGPITVNGETWDNVMPPHGNHPSLVGTNFDDLLNYIRASWGNDSETFEQGEATSYLKKHAERSGLWTVEELP